MTVFLCEDSVCGILTGVYAAWDSKKGHANVKLALKEGYQPELFMEYQGVEPDMEKADKVFRTLEQKMYREDFEALYRAVLSADEQKADSIYKMIVLALHNRRKLIHNLEHLVISHIFRNARKTANEAAHYREFLRFRELENGSLFSVLAPQAQILPLIGEHFADRFPMENFMIYDRTHHAMLLHPAGQSWLIYDGIEDFSEEALLLSEKEKEMSRGWRIFFDTVAIKERKNQKLQQQLMPGKFRRYVTEAFEKEEKSALFTK